MTTFEADPADVAEAICDLLTHARLLNPDLTPELLKVRVVCAICELMGADPNHLTPAGLNAVQAIHELVDEVTAKEAGQ